MSMSFLIGKNLKLKVVRVLNLAPVNIFCILFECTVQCPCGKSNCTFWATQLAKAKHTAAIYSESLRTQHARRAASSISPSWEETSQESTRPPMSFGFRWQFRCKERRIRVMEAQKPLSQTETSFSSDGPSHSF